MNDDHDEYDHDDPRRALSVAPTTPPPPTLVTSVVDGTQYSVSTIWRRSSSVLAPDHWYYETMAFELDNDDNVVGIAASESAYGYQGALANHNRVAAALAAGRDPDDSEENGELP